MENTISGGAEISQDMTDRCGPIANDRHEDEQTPTASSSSSSACFLDDRPCWGGPTNQCSLPDLLSLIDRSKVILRETVDYIVLNKPPDLRMDGKYAATVHKLLTYWYPSEKLLEASGSDDTSNKSVLSLQQVLSLHKFNDLADNQLRPCHQLDYATSGCLLVARNAMTARIAGDALSARDERVQKKYLAVVHGHVCIKRDEWPVLSPSDFRRSFQTVEQTYRSARAKRRNDTFIGYLPSHAVFQRWKSSYRQATVETGGEKQMSKKRRKERRNTASSIDMQALWKELLLDNEISPDSQRELCALSWSNVKQNEMWLDSFEKLTNAYNERARAQSHDGSSSSITAALPPIFCVQGEPDESFYMYGALAQVPDEFSMRLYNCNSDGSSLQQLDFKPSLTRCVVLHRGIMPNSIGPITKVQLEPKTGRRHQLRVHMAQIVGHAIVGDVTYAQQSSDGEVTRSSVHGGYNGRMCLHAYQLTLPPLLTDTVTTPDPFPVNTETVALPL